MYFLRKCVCVCDVYYHAYGQNTKVDGICWLCERVKFRDKSLHARDRLRLEAARVQKMVMGLLLFGEFGRVCMCVCKNLSAYFRRSVPALV